MPLAYKITSQYLKEKLDTFWVCFHLKMLKKALIKYEIIKFCYQ
jgi:hypothetical protein